ncbi:MAG: TlyA family RNA methyltransferase [Deltaproteobacteria bacterium]|nr:TlyA family RNA methyltransferase [Deltaproteobacteria bacterium]
MRNETEGNPERFVSKRDRLKAERFPYVSRGGVKLAHALKVFHLDVHGMTALDVGASTGGFTDCLLQHGASKVYAVDVGYGQLAEKLRKDPRVTVIDRTNIRTLSSEKLPEKVQLVTIDVSFISLATIFPVLQRSLAEDAVIVALVKPQFEVEPHEVERGGVVRDLALHQRVIEQVMAAGHTQGWVWHAVTASFLTGADGNQEYFLLFQR